MKQAVKAIYSIILLAHTFSGFSQKMSSIPVSKDSISNLSYSSILSQSISKRGLLTIHQAKNRYYCEIADSVLGKELLIVTRIERSSASTNTYPGDEINNMVVIFEQVKDKILLRKSIFMNYAGDSSSSVYQLVTRSDFRPILASFPIISYSKDSSSKIIDITSFLQADNEVESFANKKPFFSLVNFQEDKSYIDHINVFQSNVEISTVKTFLQGGPTLPPSMAGDISFQINTSIIKLPEIPAKQRLQDIRVGYFTIRQTDYNTNPEGIKDRDYIKRWRMEPKPEDIEKYKKGELVDPLKPIVFYIDPATPKKWIPYLIEAVNAWQEAFETVGFKNAIYAKEAPSKTQDSTWSLYDAQHSAIVWKPSEIQNAFGPSITDPRTGEILESHISVYHNIIQLIHDWYMVQCGMVDPAAQKIVFDDTLTGKLIRGVIMHEVGHTLGLMHNFGASSTVSVDSLRSKAWVEANGFCPSIMDYARFNYVAQPEDHISEKGLLPRIGSYDKWAIEWGYKWFPQFKTTEEETPYLINWVKEKMTDKRLWFGSEHSWDPRCQSEDLGDDVIKANNYGMKNLKRIVPLLLHWTKINNNSYENLNALYLVVQNQYATYLRHMVKNIYGTYETMKNVDQPGPIYEPISREYQMKSMSFINANLFQTPYWLVDSAILSRTGETTLGVINKMQDLFFGSLFFQPNYYSKISRQQSNYGNNSYTLIDLFNTLRKDVWTELDTHQPINLFRQNLQLLYYQNVGHIFLRAGLNTNVAISLPIPGDTYLGGAETLAIIKMHFRDLGESIKKDLPYVKDQATRYHLKYLLERINDMHGDVRL